MIYLITGGSGSGKSEFAEKTTLEISKNKERYYIATMKVYDDEGLKKVEHHRNMRDNKGFKTIECPDNIGEIIDQYNFFSSTVLFECMSNYLANKMFGEDNIISNNILSEIISDISNLSKICNNLIIVTNEVFSDGVLYDTLTQEYISYLGSINQELSKIADQVYEVIYGIPVCLKG